MPTFNDRIAGFVAGDDLEIDRTISNIPSGQHVTAAWLTIKAAATDSDAEAIIQKMINAADTPGVGQVTDDGGTSGIAAVRFDLTADDTQLLVPLQDYVFDLQVETDSGKIYTPDIGVMRAETQVTRARL